MRRMPGSVYTLPVPAILSSQILNTKNQRNVYLQKKIMIRMMPKNMIMQMISQKNLGMEITMMGMTMLMLLGRKRLGENGERTDSNRIKRTFVYGIQAIFISKESKCNRPEYLAGDRV